MPVPAGAINGVIEFTWHGDLLKRRMNDTVRFALEQTAADMVTEAQQLVHHPGDSQGYATGELQSDITAQVPYRRGNVWSIVFGSFNVDHAFWQEILPEPIGRAYIRPAVENNIDHIIDYIGAEWGGGDFPASAVQAILQGYDQINLHGKTASNRGVGSREQRRSPLGQRGTSPRRRSR